MLESKSALETGGRSQREAYVQRADEGHKGKQRQLARFLNAEQELARQRNVLPVAADFRP